MCSVMVRGWYSCARPATNSSNSARRSSPSMVALNAAFARMPWRSALRRERILPSGVRGPVERFALARLAEALRSLTLGFGDELVLESVACFIRPCAEKSWRELANAHAKSHRKLREGRILGRH